VRCPLQEAGLGRAMDGLEQLNFCNASFVRGVCALTVVVARTPGTPAASVVATDNGMPLRVRSSRKVERCTSDASVGPRRRRRGDVLIAARVRRYAGGPEDTVCGPPLLHVKKSRTHPLHLEC
jgi:hypothetical protein